jgi:hypothetical protein
MAYEGLKHVRDIVQTVRSCSSIAVYFVASTYEKQERKMAREKLAFLEM